MKGYSHFIYAICCIYRYTSIKFKEEYFKIWLWYNNKHDLYSVLDLLFRRKSAVMGYSLGQCFPRGVHIAQYFGD